MAKYTCLKDLKHNQLCFGDIVIFHSDGPRSSVMYRVANGYLSDYTYRSNTRVFNLLGVSRWRLATDSYGYDPTGEDGEDSWPQYVDDDFEAATRLVRELFKLWEDKFDVKGIKLFNKLVRESGVTK